MYVRICTYLHTDNELILYLVEFRQPFLQARIVLAAHDWWHLRATTSELSSPVSKRWRVLKKELTCGLLKKILEDFYRFLQIFRRLVLGCIDADFCVQICIFQHFSRSTRFAFFCTAPISKFADFFQFFSRTFQDCPGFLQTLAFALF